MDYLSRSNVIRRVQEGVKRVRVREGNVMRPEREKERDRLEDSTLKALKAMSQRMQAAYSWKRQGNAFSPGAC